MVWEYVWERFFEAIMGKLSALTVKSKNEPGRYGDGDGLFLIVKPTGSKSWVVRVQKNRKRRDFGLGSVSKVSLEQARTKAAAVRSQMEAGLDPIIERLKEEGIPTFRKAAAAVHSEQKPAWRNSKHAKQWMTTLETYVFPKLGDVAVNKIEGGQVRDVLAAIWLNKPETARRVRQRIGQVIDWAVGKGYRETPISMTVINRSLPKVARSEKHHPSMPYRDVPAFMKTLHAKPTIARLALELLILSASRPQEVRLADWSQFDLEANTWTRPIPSMKGKRVHVVPLTEPIKDFLVRLQAFTGTRSGYLFEGNKRGKPISEMTMNKVLRDADLIWVPHGFRSTFREWVSEETTFDGETAEQALAHVIANKTEAAYRRGNQLEKRRVMMAAWNDYCDGKVNKVVRLVG